MFFLVRQREPMRTARDDAEPSDTAPPVCVTPIHLMTRG
jgi:hypothetical protein